MDEPLSNLDAKLRLEMRAEIRRIHDELGATTIYVTHDQDEALSLADRIVVLRDGEVRQVGTPEELYERPAHLDVAEFMGFRNALPGTVVARRRRRGASRSTRQRRPDGARAASALAGRATPMPSRSGPRTSTPIRPRRHCAGDGRDDRVSRPRHSSARRDAPDGAELVFRSHQRGAGRRGHLRAAPSGCSSSRSA